MSPDTRRGCASLAIAAMTGAIFAAPVVAQRDEDPVVDILSELVRIPGVSGREEGVREAIIEKLPRWAPSIHLNPPSGATAATPVTVETLLIDVGTASRDETFGLGVQLLDPITVPKTFTRLAGTRVAGRSMDDRFGCAALVALALGIEPREVSGTLTIAWSVQEELGLIGAEALAREFSPDVVIPVDTFVTSDSPIESKRIGNASLGEGPIIRALDRSNVAPIALVRALLAFAERNDLVLRYGATSGGNDGSVFRTGNSSVLPLAIPLRYAHTAVETIDTRDLTGLVRLLRAMVRDVSWIQ